MGWKLKILQLKKKIEFHGGYMAYLRSHSLQRREMIGHHNNQNIFSLHHLRHLCCAQLFTRLARGTDTGIPKRHKGIKAGVTSGSTVPEANIRLSLLAQREKGIPSQRCRETPCQPRCSVPSVRAPTTETNTWTGVAVLSSAMVNQGREESNLEFATWGTPFIHN